MMLEVCLIGAGGRMGREIVAALGRESDLRLAMAVGRSSAGRDAGEVAGVGHLGVPTQADLGAALAASRPDLAIDVSVPGVVAANARALVEAGVPSVIGATGLDEMALGDLHEQARAAGVPLLVAPNFAVGALLMMRFCALAARFFEWAEIIEYHHEKKADAPSGTAFKTALAMREARGSDFLRVGGDEGSSVAPGSRGASVGGVGLHAVRLPGMLAHQEVVFGMAGQTLRVRHDALTRECYMPGVLLAARKVRSLEAGVTFGLEQLLD